MDQDQPATEAPGKPATAGVLLKTAREAQGLHIAALAVTLKVPVSKLEALEANRCEAVGESVFTRALAASVCRVLKIDAAPVLAAMPHSEIPRFKTDDAGLNTPFKRGGIVSGPQLKSRLTSPMSLAVALLLLGILLVFLWPEHELEALAPAGVPATVQTEVLRTVPAVEPAAPAASAPVVTALPASLAPAAVAQEAAPVPVVSQIEVPAVLVLASRGVSWVEIKDAHGVLQLRKNLDPGEQVQSQGPLPLTVVLGHANHVDVSVRGQRLDLTGVTKANVARFEVK